MSENRSLSDLMEQAAEDEQVSLPSSDSVTDLTSLVASLDEAERKVSEIEEQLKEAKKVAKRISEQDIPTLFAEMGSVQSLELTDGRKVTVKDDFAVSIKKADQPLAYNWLRDNNKSEIIKRSLTLQFDRGQSEEAEKALCLLLDNGLEATDAESVHHSTLKASLKGMIEDGTNLPDMFNYYPYQKTVIK